MEALLSRDTLDPRIIAQSIAAQFSELAEVEAIALGGSLGTNRADVYSDIDLYIFCRSVILVETRALIIEPRASRMELDNEFWGRPRTIGLRRKAK